MNYKTGLFKPLYAIVVLLMLMCLSSEADTVTIDGVVSNDPSSWYFVGNTTPSNWLIVTNAGALTVSNATLGGEAAATGNVALITGAGSAWTSRYWLIIGSNAGANTLMITNGGWTVSSNAVIGFNNLAASNHVFIAGTGSVWSNFMGGPVESEYLAVGREGGWNELRILNGGKFYQGDQVAVGLSHTNSGGNNSVIISGPEALFYAKSHVWIGYSSDLLQQNGNLVRVENGGQYRSDRLYVGRNSVNNEIRITGTNSILTAAGFTIVGYSGSSNSLFLVESNGQATVVGLYVCWYADNNTVQVDGNGSRLTISGDNTIGHNSAANGKLFIRNGGYLSCNSGFIGRWNDSHNHTAYVRGEGSVWSNTYSLMIGTNGNRGNGLIISNGAFVKIGGNLNLQVGYVTNYVAGRSSGLELLATNGLINVVTGGIHIAFVSKPATNGFYWGLRWAGNHTNELNTLRGVGQLTWDDSIFQNPFYTSPVAISYDATTTNTYVGLWYNLTQGIFCTFH